MGDVDRICTVLSIEREGSMKLLTIVGKIVTFQLSDDDVQVLDKYAHREEIPRLQVLEEVIESAIEELVFNKG